MGADGTVKGAYIALKDVKAQLGKSLKNVTNARGQAMKQPMPQVVLIQDPRTGKTIEAVKREDAKLAGAKVPEPAKKADSYAQQQQAQAERHARERDKVKAEREIRLQMLQRVRDAAAERERSALDLQLIAPTAQYVYEFSLARRSQAWTTRTASCSSSCGPAHCATAAPSCCPRWTRPSWPGWPWTARC